MQTRRRNVAREWKTVKWLRTTGRFSRCVSSVNVKDEEDCFKKQELTILTIPNHYIQIIYFS